MGMYIHELCGSWIEHPFWRTQFVIKDVKDIRRIAESGITEVWIDVSKGLDVAAAETRSQAVIHVEIEQTLTKMAVRAEPPKKVSVADEVRRAKQICDKGKKAVISMFHEARMGKAVSTEAAEDIVDEISSSVMRNPGALISLARLKTADDYTYMHSVAVCALMVTLARQLDIDEKLTREIGLAGLLHDLGKALMPMDVLNKPGKLTDNEFAIIKGHPEAGYKLLVEGNAVGEIPMEVCLHHHEKTDGSGYPHRLNAVDISLYAKMGAVCDVYDAITSNRPYKAGWDPAEAIKKMTEWCKGHFEESIFNTFVKSIGIYPIGSLVRLESGRLAIVIDQTSKSLLTPQVKVFFWIKSKLQVKPEVIDLSRKGCNDRIIGREDPGKWGFKNLDQLWIS